MSTSSSPAPRAVDLRSLKYSFSLLFDQPETRTLFKQFLTRIKRINVFEFVAKADEYILLKSNVNRYRVALEIVDTFIQPLNTLDQFTPSLPSSASTSSQLLDVHSEWKSQFLALFATCNEESCPRSLFEELYEQKMIELQYDCFRRFIKSDMFFQFMEKELKQLGMTEFMTRYVSKSFVNSDIGDNMNDTSGVNTPVHSTRKRHVYNEAYENDNDSDIDEDMEIEKAIQLLQLSKSTSFSLDGNPNDDQTNRIRQISAYQHYVNLEELLSKSVTSTLALCFHKEILMEQQYVKQRSTSPNQQSSLPWHAFGVKSIRQIKELVRKLIHPRFGIPKQKFIIGTKDRLMSTFSSKTTKKLVKRLMRRRLIFSGEALVTYMCLHFGLDNTNSTNRYHMTQLAQLLLQKNIIGQADTLNQIVQGNEMASQMAQKLHDYCLETNLNLNIRSSPTAPTTALDKPKPSTSAMTFKDSSKNNYMFIFKKKLIVIGGGMAGAVAARDLSDMYDVTVIDKKTKLEFMFGLCRLIGDPNKVSNYQLDIRETITSKARYVQGRVAHVTDQVVAYYDLNDSSKMRIIPFDYLVVASGSSYARPFPILTTDQKNACIIYPYSSQSVLDYLPIVREANSIAVIGGGPVAVEFVSEICTYCASHVQVTLIAQCDVLLERLCAAAHEDTFKELSKFPNLKFLFNRRVTRVAGDMIECCYNGESVDSRSSVEIQADVIFCCVGNKPNTEFLRRFMLDSLSERGYIRVHRNTLQVLKSKVMDNKKPTLLNSSQLLVPSSPMTANTATNPTNNQEVPSLSVTPANSDTTKKTSNNGNSLNGAPKSKNKRLSQSMNDESSGADPTDDDTASDTSTSSVFDDVEVIENVKSFFSRANESSDGEQLSPNQKPVVLDEKDHYENIFALGDVADTHEEKMAYVARNQGYALVQILDQIESGEPITPYKPLKQKTQMISIGPNSAIAIKGNKVVTKGYVSAKMKTYVESNIIRDMKKNRRRPN